MMWGVLLLTTTLGLAAPEPLARVQVTHRDLVPECLNGAAVPPKHRSWNLPSGHVWMALTMRRIERPGVSSGGGEPGTAAISFDIEAGHRYEVEVRASTEAFSTRVWRSGEWTPVVRDRTTDRIVSSAPQWIVGTCVTAK